MIRNVLEWPFCKVILDHLVVGDELIVEPGEIRSKVNEIMVNWTHNPLEYVDNDAFLKVMCDISLGELSSVVSDLSDSKAAGLSDIPNEFWKCCGNKMMTYFLDLLNSYLMISDVFITWKRAWISMISKPYDWDRVLTNTRPIALIETARKILSKVLSNHISSAYNKCGILHGDNFLVLRGTSTQSPIFAVDSVIKDALKKDHEIWLVLQDMHKISSLLETPVNTESARKTFYKELIQNTNLPTNHNFASIITEINKKIEHHTQQRYPITYASKGKGKLQTPTVTPKKIQLPTWKKTKVESPTNSSYYYTFRSAINILSTGASTSNVTSAFGQFSFQSKQRKTELLRPYGEYFEEFKLQLPTPLGI
ncbi:hypothetical protein G9A89_014207 [Geosiphon pyriformis]|nr:hypothetical protein G9A89_014207 [Geosiphon pyriformis]